MAGRGLNKRVSLAYDRPKAKILLVEEEPSDFRHYYGVLRATGHEVVSCGSYSAALTLLDCGNFDMVVVGQGGPAFEGRQVLSRALEINPEMPVLVVARTLDMDCYLEAMEMGAADYLERYSPARDLMRSVDAHLQLRAAA
jgi:DNA-binding NtrC family response regulator